MNNEDLDIFKAFEDFNSFKEYFEKESGKDVTILFCDDKGCNFCSNPISQPPKVIYL